MEQILKPIDIDQIVQKQLPTDQYFREEQKKTQIVIHHTVSGDGVEGDINWWKQTPERIATSIIIGRDGTIYQCFKTSYWAHHLGVTSAFLKQQGVRNYATQNLILNKGSVAIELDSWGGLVKSGNLYYPALSPTKPNLKAKGLPESKVITYPKAYRSYKSFELYTDAQLVNLGKLLLYLKDKFGIPLTYNESMWEVNGDALRGKSGLWTHTSFRSDKMDCHPQPSLIAMLKQIAAVK